MLLFSDPCTYKAARGSSLAVLYDECRAKAAAYPPEDTFRSLTATSASDSLDLSNLAAVLMFSEVVHGASTSCPLLRQREIQSRVPNHR